MTRTTGGSAWAATSTRSRPFPYAYSRASSVCLTPSCSPFSSIKRTRGTRIDSLIRVWGSGRRGGSQDPRRGLKSVSPSCRCPPSETKKPLTRSGEEPRQPASVEPPRRGSGGERRFRPYLPGAKRSKLAPEFHERLRALGAAALADRKRLVALGIAVDDGERDLLDLRVPDPLADGLVGVVDLDPVGREPRGEVVRRLPMALADGHDPDLRRRDPERERAAVVLGEDADEALERTEERAVDHVRRVLLVVGAHEAAADPRRLLRVELDRPHLPGAAKRVGHVQVDLRAVERAVARVELVLERPTLERRLQRRLGEVPLLVGPELVVGTRRELEARLELEQVVQVLRVVEAAEDLVLDLLACAEDVRVVLRHDPDARQAVQRAGELVAVQRRRLGVAKWQLAVAAERGREEPHVAGTVHRLDRVRAVAFRDQEHVLAELLPVARLFPEQAVVDERRAHLDVATACVLAAADVLERVPDHHPLRVPEGRARRDIVEVEQVELHTEAAVVALARFLETFEVGVEIVLREERGPVDACQLLVVLVAAPVRAGEAGQLERLDRLRVQQVRTSAEVGEVALRVEADRAFGGVDELDLVRLVPALEAHARVLGGDLVARPLAALGELPLDLGLDPLQVVLVDRLREVEVVVEAVLDRRPDGDLHARVEAPDRLGEEVRARVAQDGERIGIVAVARRQDLDRLAVCERQAQVAHVAVRADEHRLLCELGPDRAGRLQPGGTIREVELVAVWEDDLHDLRIRSFTRGVRGAIAAPTAEQPTGTVTLLFNDVEGSTQLLHQLGTERYASALDLHRRLLREAFAAHGGYEADAEGDAFFVAFATAPQAVAAASAAQARLA